MGQFAGFFAPQCPIVAYKSPSIFLKQFSLPSVPWAFYHTWPFWETGDVLPFLARAA